jgi:hypothetical protein
MRFVIVIIFALSVLGCTDDGDDDIPCTPFPEWHAPLVTVIESVDALTLACTDVERTSSCPSDTHGCCYGEHDTSTGGDVDCSTIEPCGAYDEPACLADARCFVARNSLTQAFLGCYLATRDGQTASPCTGRASDACINGECVALYDQPPSSTPRFVSCTDR